MAKRLVRIGHVLSVAVLTSGLVHVLVVLDPPTKLEEAPRYRRRLGEALELLGPGREV